MSRVDEAAKNRLYNELAEKLDEGETLMQLLPTSQWDDLVTNDRLDAHLARLDARFAQVDARFAQVDARFAQVDAKIDTGFAHMDAKMAKGFRDQLVWLIAAISGLFTLQLALFLALR